MLRTHHNVMSIVQQGMQFLLKPQALPSLSWSLAVSHHIYCPFSWASKDCYLVCNTYASASHAETK